MRFNSMSAILLTLAPLAIGLPGTAAQAQAQDNERINQVIVYGEDPCPRSTGDEIVVCARKGENERFRIPAPLRGNPGAPESNSWVNKAEQLEYVGRSGIGSCSPAGAGGASGCFAQLIRQAREEREGGDGTNWTALVEAAREQRLGQIDAESAQIEAELKAAEAAKANKQPQ